MERPHRRGLHGVGGVVRHIIAGYGMSQKDNMPPFKRRITETGFSNEMGTTDVVVKGSASHSKRGAQMHKKKTVKVSKGFKAKVASVMSAKEFTGHKTDFFYQALVNSGLNLQGVGWAADNNAAPCYSKWSFLPEYFLDAASCLFNQKAQTPAAWKFNSVLSLGNGVAPATGAGSAVKFHIANSFEHYVFKNVTQRGVKIKLLEFAPKRCSYISANPINNAGITTNVETDALIDPLQYWTNSIANDITNGFQLSTFGISPSYLGFMPGDSPTMMKGFKHSTTEVFLEPGASYSYFLQGPSNFDYDSEKMFATTLYQSIQKYSRYVLPIVSSELLLDSASDAVNSFGRFPMAFSRAVSINCERKMYCKIKMPDEAGFVVSSAAVGTPQALGERRNCMIYNNWPGQQGGSLGTTPVFTDILRQTEVFANNI